MRVVVAGAGNVGTHVALDLAKGTHDITLVDINPTVIKRLAATDGVRAVAGDACEVAFLNSLDLQSADVVVAATGDDEDNLVISLLAKQEYGVPKVVARVNHPENEWMFNQSWGVDRSVSTPHILTGMIEEAVSVGSLVRLLSFKDAQLVEVTLSDKSPLVGQTLAEITLPRDASIVAVIRDSHVVVPSGSTRLEANDEILALVTNDSEEPFRDSFEI